MTLKRCIFRFWVRLLERLTIIKPEVCELNTPTINQCKDKTLIFTVAFNNVTLIRYQNVFLRKNINDDFVYLVADNSSDINIRKQIESYCSDENISYLSLPHNLLNHVGGSYSHAMCLNYVYKHVIKKCKPRIFGFIDHDLFPIKEVSIADKLKNQPVYGPLRERGECWYMSAIMSFFRYDFMADKKVDFMPVKPFDQYLDTGGGNWAIYSTLNKKDILFPDELTEPFREGGARHSDMLEYFDNKTWLHTINGSCWHEEAEGKGNMIRSILTEYLKQ